MDLRTPSLNRLFDLWLDEDIGRGDLTNRALQKKKVSAHWIAKQEGVFCGGSLAEQIFHRLDKSVAIKPLLKDGDCFSNRQRLLEIEGPAEVLLAGERTTLNLAMRLSGISTSTAQLVKELKGSNVQLVDTRKTTPGLRVLEKYAFRCGGGINHRLGLDDAAMLKENHLAWSESLNAAFSAIRSSSPWSSKIIVEAETPTQAEEAVIAGADGILLDEIPPDTLKNLVPRLRDLANNCSSNHLSGKIILEASGVNPRELKAYANTGVDLISSSAPMTKSSWIDLSMHFD